MFSSIILVCTLDLTQCQGGISPQFYSSKEDCEFATQAVIPIIRERGFIVVDSLCYDWGSGV